MKFSKFNVFFEHQNKKYVSNTYSKAVIVLDEKHYDILKNKKEQQLEEITDDIACLSEQGILVEDDLDEIGLLRYAYEQSKYSPEDMEFVIAPTMQCNFKCSYCFEEHHSGNMSKTIQSKVLKFFEEKISKNNCKRVFFVWFGGEPLLCLDIIEDMTKKIIEICQKYNVKIYINLITNGYLLNKHSIRKLEVVGVEHIQITVDGIKKTHDQRRMLKNGEGTFDVIYNNLSLFKNSKITVAVRVNIDSNNLNAYDKVVQLVENLENPNIVCHPAIVVPTENQEISQRNSCLSRCDMNHYYAGAVGEYYLKRRNSVLKSVTNNCGAEHFYSYVIDEKGLIYKCWNSIGYESQALCSVDDELHKNSSILSRYWGRDPFTEEECKDCAYIPICAGGCIEQMMQKGQHECVPEKYLYKEIIVRKLLDKTET